MEVLACSASARSGMDHGEILAFGDSCPKTSSHERNVNRPLATGSGYFITPPDDQGISLYFTIGYMHRRCTMQAEPCLISDKALRLAHWCVLAAALHTIALFGQRRSTGLAFGKSGLYQSLSLVNCKVDLLYAKNNHHCLASSFITVPASSI